jgi:hypothetical protein
LPRSFEIIHSRAIAWRESLPKPAQQTGGAVVLDLFIAVIGHGHVYLWEAVGIIRQKCDIQQD